MCASWIACFISKRGLLAVDLPDSSNTFEFLLSECRRSTWGLWLPTDGLGLGLVFFPVTIDIEDLGSHIGLQSTHCGSRPQGWRSLSGMDEPSDFDSLWFAPMFRGRRTFSFFFGMKKGHHFGAGAGPPEPKLLAAYISTKKPYCEEPG